MSMTFRTKSTEAKYRLELANRKDRGDTSCPLCTLKTLHEWKYWRLVDNTYPYDAIMSLSHILVLKEHQKDVTMDALEELHFDIKKLKFMKDYGQMTENIPWRQSVPDHFHIHLLMPKPEYL